MAKGIRNNQGRGWHVVPIVFAVLFLTLTAESGYGQTGPSLFNAQNLDVVIVLDQSESMDGVVLKGEKASDPEGQRISVVRRVVTRIAADVFESSRYHRVCLIEFGSEAKVSIPWTDFSFDPKDPAKSTEIATLVTDQLQRQNLVYTNTPAALRLALDQLKGRPHLAPDKEPRRKIVLLVTDGRPDRLSRDGGKEPLEKLRREVLQIGTEARRDDVGMWVIGIDVNGEWNMTPKEGGASDGDFWEDITGKNHQTERAPQPFPDLVQFINRFVDFWLQNPPSNPVDPTFIATPYLRQLMVTVDYRDSRPPAVFTGPTGYQILPLTGAKVGEATLSNIFLINDPAPGKYKLDVVSSSDVLIQDREFGPNVKMIAPAGEVEREVATRVVFQLDTFIPGVPMEFLPAWPITGVFILKHDEEGRITEIPLHMTDHGQIEGAWTPLQPGNYTGELKLTVRGPGMAPFDVFHGADMKRFRICLQ